MERRRYAAWELSVFASIEDVSMVGRECAALPTVGERLFLTYIHPYPLESDPGYNNYDPCTKPEPINYSGSDYGLDLVGLLHTAPVGINSLGVGGLGMWRIVVSVMTADMPPGICDPPQRRITTTLGKWNSLPST